MSRSELKIILNTCLTTFHITDKFPRENSKKYVNKTLINLKCNLQMLTQIKNHVNTHWHLIKTSV